MFDLAPDNPYSLPLRWPVLARAGLRGAGVVRLAGTEGVGAVISDVLLPHAQPPVTWHETPAGMLWPDAGGRSIRQARHDLVRWAALNRPVVVAFRAAAPAQLQPMLAELDPEAHPALLLDLTAIPDAATAGELVAAARRAWRKPLLAELPFDGPPLLPLVDALGDVDALLLGRGSRAVAGHNPLVDGRLVGPAVHPMILAATLRLAAHTPKVVISAAATWAEARALLAAGAAAVLLDVGLWHNPDLAAHIASLATT